MLAGIGLYYCCLAGGCWLLVGRCVVVALELMVLVLVRLLVVVLVVVGEGWWRWVVIVDCSSGLCSWVVGS